MPAPATLHASLNPPNPATLPKTPTQKSPTRPFSKLQCSVNGAYAALTTISLLHLHTNLSWSSSFFPFLLHPRASLIKSSPTCVIQNLELHIHAQFCFSVFHPSTPFELRYAPFSRNWYRILTTTCIASIPVATLSLPPSSFSVELVPFCLSLCIRSRTLLPQVHSPINPHNLTNILKSDIKALSAFSLFPAISNRELGIFNSDALIMTVVFAGRVKAFWIIERERVCSCRWEIEVAMVEARREE